MTTSMERPIRKRQRRNNHHENDNNHSLTMSTSPMWTLCLFLYLSTRFTVSAFLLPSYTRNLLVVPTPEGLCQPVYGFQGPMVRERPTITTTTRVYMNSAYSPRNHPGEADDDGKDSSRLMKYLFKKKKKGVSDVKLREAEELGGVPRSDRYSSKDWLHNTITMPSSAILHAVKGPVTFMTTWATFLSLLFMRLEQLNPVAAKAMSLPQSPHSLMVSALSLLLVFKTNSAYQRFAEGRKIWESIINISRDLYRLMNLYENEMGKSKRRRLQRLLAAFPYLLRHRIRPNLVMYRLDDAENVRDPENSIVLYQDRAADDLDPEAAAVAAQEENARNARRSTRPLYWVDKRTLPWRLLPKNALEACARAQNRPLWVCDRMGQELRMIPDGPNFTARERLAFISKVEKLSGCIGACERIHQTAVPLNYARHSLRALTLWLFTLPFALVGSLKLLTGPVLFLVSWLLFGVYEIGYSIEDPFQGTLRLSVLCDTIRRDVLADEVIRSTAFVVEEDEFDHIHSTTMSSTSSSSASVSSSSLPSVSTTQWMTRPTTTVQQGGGTGAVTAAAAGGGEDYDDDVDDEMDWEGDNGRDYEASTVFRPPQVAAGEPSMVVLVEEEGLYDEEDRDYESSPIRREPPTMDVNKNVNNDKNNASVMKAEESSSSSSSEGFSRSVIPPPPPSSSSNPIRSSESVVEVEELPNIPIFSSSSETNLSSEYLRNNKKP